MSEASSGLEVSDRERKEDSALVEFAWLSSRAMSALSAVLARVSDAASATRVTAAAEAPVEGFSTRYRRRYRTETLDHQATAPEASRRPCPRDRWLGAYAWIPGTMEVRREYYKVLCSDVASLQFQRR